MGYSLWGRKESDTTSLSLSVCVNSSHPELTSNLLKPIGFISIVSLLFFILLQSPP